MTRQKLKGVNSNPNGVGVGGNKNSTTNAKSPGGRGAGDRSRQQQQESKPLSSSSPRSRPQQQQSSVIAGVNPATIPSPAYSNLAELAMAVAASGGSDGATASSLVTQLLEQQQQLQQMQQSQSSAMMVFPPALSSTGPTPASGSGPSSNENQGRGDVKSLSFTMKIHHFLAQNDGCVAWTPDGRCLRVVDPFKFQERVIPKYFDYTGFTSFLCELLSYGFKKISHAGFDECYYHDVSVSTCVLILYCVVALLC